MLLIKIWGWGVKIRPFFKIDFEIDVVHFVLIWEIKRNYEEEHSPIYLKLTFLNHHKLKICDEKYTTFTRKYLFNEINEIYSVTNIIPFEFFLNCIKLYNVGNVENKG